MRFSDLLVPIAVDSLDSFGDVGYLHFDFLDKVLPHCTRQQLLHIQKETKDTDLSPITDRLWKKFFESDFDSRATARVVDEMKIKNKSFMWYDLYQAESKRVEEAEKQVGQRLKKSYENEAALKQNRQIRVLEKLRPPPSKKTNLINKVKKRHLNSLEVRNRQAMKMKSAAPKCGSSLIKKPRMTYYAGYDLLKNLGVGGGLNLLIA